MSDHASFNSFQEKALLRQSLDEDFRFVAQYVKEQILPVILAATDIAKTLIGLSAGAIVLSISATQVARERLTPFVGSWLLPASWALFTLTILLSLYRAGMLIGVHGYGWILYSQRGAILDEFDRIVTVELAAAHIRDKRNAAVAKADAVLVGILKKEEWIAPITGWTFIIGMVTLILFAILNLIP